MLSFTKLPNTLPNLFIVAISNPPLIASPDIPLNNPEEKTPDDCFAFLVVLLKAELILLTLDGNAEKAVETFVISVAKGDKAFVNSFIFDVKLDISVLLKFLLISGIFCN